MIKAKKDRPEVIVRLQHKEIADLTLSVRALNESIEFYKKDMEHYKSRYNEIARERDAKKQQIWRMTIVEKVLLHRVDELEGACGIPVESRIINNE